MQDGWAVEIRQRKSGKMANALYNVWVTPQNRLIYTMSLGCGLEVLPRSMVISILEIKLRTSGFYSPHSPMRKDAKQAGFKDPDDKVNKAKKSNLVLKSGVGGTSNASVDFRKCHNT